MSVEKISAMASFPEAFIAPKFGQVNVDWFGALSLSMLRAVLVYDWSEFYYVVTHVWLLEVRMIPTHLMLSPSTQFIHVILFIAGW